jgi:DNA replication protein DnaC
MPTISNTEQPSAECPICGGLGYVRENVPIGHPDFGKMFPCRCKMAELEKQRMD